MTDTTHEWPQVTRDDLLNVAEKIHESDLFCSLYLVQPLNEDGILIYLNREGDGRASRVCILKALPAEKEGYWECDLWRMETDRNDLTVFALQVMSASEPPDVHAVLSGRPHWEYHQQSATTPEPYPTLNSIARYTLKTLVYEMTTLLHERKPA